MSQLNRDAPAPQPPVVFVVDDDDGVRRGMEFLLPSAGYEVRSFESGQAFLDACRPGMRGCVLLDVRMPGMDGLELQEHLKAKGIRIPVIIVTAFANVPMAVRAIQAGAFDFIEKPFEGADLLERIRRALVQEQQQAQDERQLAQTRDRLDSLTPRERQVMELVVSGKLNKQIAAELGISMKTVENHRARVMEKMQAESLAELVRMTLGATRA